MTLLSVRKVFQGIADRRQMFRMFDRHAQRPEPSPDDAHLYCGEWFEVGQPEHDYMLEILPPLWMRGDAFAMRECLTGSITSVFFALTIDNNLRFFHAYCDLSDRSSSERMRMAIVADGRTLRQIVMNLLSNSIKFTGPGGQVIASTSLAESGEAVLRIRDTGEGMSEEELTRALEPFRQQLLVLSGPDSVPPP